MAKERQGKKSAPRRTTGEGSQSPSSKQYQDSTKTPDRQSRNAGSKIPKAPKSAIPASRVLENIRAGRIPAALRELPRWVLWRWEVKIAGQRITKPPYQANGKNAKSNTPRTWTTFLLAVEALRRGGFDGLGFVLTGEEFFGFDFDHVRDPASGEIKPEAEARIRALDSFAEVSPSGMGVRVFARGTLPAGGRKRGDVECYSKGRYLTVTGERLAGAPEEIQERTAAAARVHAELFAKKDDGKKGPFAAPLRVNLELTDQELLERARAARNGERFSRLWTGEWEGLHPSQSEADLELVGSLAFWTGGDAERMDRLFRASGLMRPKWDSKRGTSTYGAMTIQKAIAEATDFYTGREGLQAEREIPSIAGRLAHLFCLTDVGNAERFALWYGDRLRFDHKRGRWLLWVKHWWRDDVDEKVGRLAIKSTRRHYREGGRIEDTKIREDVASFAIKSEARAKRTDTLATARILHPIADAGEGWDADPWLLAVDNGVIDLRTGELRDGKPEDRITEHIPFAFDPAATCPRWIKFLEEVFEGKDQADLLDFIFRAIGYSLTGGTQEQVGFWCYGRGANGKSVCLDTLRHVLGPFAHDAGFGMFEDRRGMVHPEEMAELAGRRLVTASEAREGRRLNEARMKAIQHGDTTSARFLRERRFNFALTAKLWLAFNHRPVVKDDSLGFWRSVRLIPFLRRFEGKDADPGLLEKLKAEAPGILAWAVRGCLAWKRNGLPLPACVKAATREYQTESDPLGIFLEERCRLSPEAAAPAGELFKAYKAWAEGEGMGPKEIMSATLFGRRMGERFEKLEKARPRQYRGVELLGSGTDFLDFGNDSSQSRQV